MNNLAERWHKFNILEQMGNIGSEIYRALQWQKRGDAKNSRLALDFALELFDLTLADSRWAKIKGRLKEIARAREVVCDLFLGQNQYNETGEALMKYFDEFALAARKDK